MSENTGKNVVSLLEEHIDHVILTVKQLRDEKHQLETEIERLNSDLQQREEKIQELEKRNSDLQENAEEERASIRRQLEGLMSGLTEDNESGDDSDATENKPENEVLFKAQN